jgi:iron complex outermembrane receptor protein
MIARRSPLALLLTLTSLTLAAQQPPKPVDLTAEMDEFLHTDQIQAASKRVQDVASAPADVVILRGSELKALGYRTLGDALGGVLGFRSNNDHAYQGMGMAGVYTLGDQNTRLLVLLDGHALNSPAEVGSSKVGEDFGIPLELVDHIELVRGPASSLYGNNAFQGLVNVSTVFAARTVETPFQAAATGGSGGLGELWAQGTTSFQGITASLMLSGFRRTGTALELPELQGQPLPAAADREDRQSAYLYVRGQEWTFAGTLLSRTQRLASGPYGAVAGDPDNFYRNRRLSAEFKWEPRSDRVKWLVRLFGDRNTFFDSFKTPVLDQVNQDQDQDPDRSLGLELQGRMALADHLSLTFGTEFQSHHYSGSYQDSGGEPSVASKVAYLIGNTYLEGNWAASPAWTLVAGLQRADWIPSQVQSSIGSEVQDLQKQSSSRLTPRFSVIWKPGSADVVKAVFGQGFRFPTLFERYYTDGATQVPNPGIKPEVITSSQLSWARKWSPRLSTHVAFSLFDWKEAIVQGSLGVGDAAMAQYQNAADPKKGKALEAEANGRWGELEVAAGAGWYDWTYQGAPLDNAARWTGNLRAIQRFSGWSVAGELRYVGARQASFPNASTPGTSTVPANWTLRASLRREMAHGWLQASVEDLGNSRRRDLVAPEYDPVTRMAADGRALRLTLGFRM